MCFAKSMVFLFLFVALFGMAAAIRQEAPGVTLGRRVASTMSKQMKFGRRGLHTTGKKFTMNDVNELAQMYLGDDLFHHLQKGPGTRAYLAAKNAYMPSARVTAQTFAAHGQGPMGRILTNKMMTAHGIGPAGRQLTNKMLAAHGFGPNGQKVVRDGLKRLQNSQFMKLLEKQNSKATKEVVKESVEETLRKADDLLKDVNKILEKGASLLQEVNDTETTIFWESPSFEAANDLAKSVGLSHKEVLVNSLMLFYNQALQTVSEMVQGEWSPDSSKAIEDAMMSMSMGELQSLSHQIDETFSRCRDLIETVARIEATDTKEDLQPLEFEDLSKMEELE